MAKIIEIGSAKGGVAKTTTTYNLAYVLKEMGHRVLAVDLDPQANLSICFGVEDTATVQVTIGHLLMNVIDDEDLPETKEYIMSRNGVDFIPASIMLSAVEAKLRMEMGSEKMDSDFDILYNYLECNQDYGYNGCYGNQYIPDNSLECN